MKAEIHSLYWPGTDLEIVDNHKKVMNHFAIKVNYHEQQIDHGWWMTNVIERSKSDIICFLDIDCVPLSALSFMEQLKKLAKSKTFFGVAQVSNHIPPATHIYAAPAFYGIHKDCWNKLRVPMVAGSDGVNAGDVCELFTYAAEKANIPFELLYPKYYYKPSSEGVWRLADKGCYGIGTIFEDTVYHLYQSRFSENIGLFKQHCYDIINGSLDYSNFIEVRS